MIITWKLTLQNTTSNTDTDITTYNNNNNNYSANLIATIIVNGAT